MNELKDIKSLDVLWEYTDNLHKRLYPNSTLAPIMGGGKLLNPKFMFVFINPTYRNVSSELGWEGKRRPWTGTKYIWKIFNKAGLFDEPLLDEIQRKTLWDIAFSDKVYNHIAERKFYFTNIVKWTGENGDLPDAIKIKTFLPILLREIELVNPEYIVTFGLIPFNTLVNQSIKLKDYYEESVSTNKLGVFSVDLGDQKFNVIPCYFPVGRGDPKKATKLLSLLP